MKMSLFYFHATGRRRSGGDDILPSYFNDLICNDVIAIKDFTTYGIVYRDFLCTKDLQINVLEKGRDGLDKI